MKYPENKTIQNNPTDKIIDKPQRNHNKILVNTIVKFSTF